MWEVLVPDENETHVESENKTSAYTDLREWSICQGKFFHFFDNLTIVVGIMSATLMYYGLLSKPVGVLVV